MLVCAALLLGVPGRAGAQHPPITIPPAPQVAPPAPSASPPGIPPAPRALLPTDVKTLRDPQGAGIVMYGQATGTAPSALAVVAAIFAYSQAFDRGAAPLLVVWEEGDRAAQALFAGAVHGAPILGIAAVKLYDYGGDVSVFYDYAASFEAAFPRLQQVLEQNGGTAGLTMLHLADGSEIGVGAGWRVIGQGKGLVDLAGPLGEFLSLGDVIPVYAGPTGLAGSAAQGPCCDPAMALQAAFPQVAANAQRRGLPVPLLTGIVESTEAPPPTAGQGAFVLANLNAADRPYSYLALVEAIGGFTDPWTLRLSGAMAPQPVFAAELPALLQIWSSFSANPPGFDEILDKAAQAMATLRPMLHSPVAAYTTAVYRASGGWDEVIRAVSSTSSADGNHPPVENSIAQALLDRLAKEAGKPWHIAPSPLR